MPNWVRSRRAVPYSRLWGPRAVTVTGTSVPADSTAWATTASSTTRGQKNLHAPKKRPGGQFFEACRWVDGRGPYSAVIWARQTLLLRFTSGRMLVGFSVTCVRGVVEL
jgi:hypothetical protein